MSTASSPEATKISQCVLVQEVGMLWGRVLRVLRFCIRCVAQVSPGHIRTFRRAQDTMDQSYAATNYLVPDNVSNRKQASGFAASLESVEVRLLTNRALSARKLTSGVDLNTQPTSLTSTHCGRSAASPSTQHGPSPIQLSCNTWCHHYLLSLPLTSCVAWPRHVRIPVLKTA